MTRNYEQNKTLSDIRRELTEELDHKIFGPMLDSFVSFASEKLGIKSQPSLKLEKDLEATSFGGYNPSDNSIVVVSKNRHPMDIFRTVAHELVHHKQNEDGRIKDVAQEGSTGSEIENEANAEAGKIMRWFAKANPSMFSSSYVTESFLEEGLQDPSIKKAVFLAGGPGSGKDFIMKRTLHGHGLTEINSDTALEYLMTKRGLDKKMPESEKVERDIVRGRAKNIRDEKQRLALAGRQGLIINGTADDPDKLARAKEMFERHGYKTMMVYVDTNNEVSRQRNIKRGLGGGREVPEDIRQEKWNAAQEAKGRLKELFGSDRFVHIDNSADYRSLPKEDKQNVDDHHLKIFKKVRKFVYTPHEDQSWEKQEMQKRKITTAPQNRSAKISTRPRTEPPKQQYAPNASELEQAKRLGIQHIGSGQFGVKTKQGTVPTHVSNKGQLVMAEEKKMKDDPCWKGYQMVGKKKKNGKEVPNCVPVDEQFEDYLNDPAKREWGTKSLADLYKNATPGQSTVSSKKKLKRKRLAQEDNAPALGYEFGQNGIGPTFGVVRSPTGLGGGYSLPLTSMAESIQTWANKETTINRFFAKYGELAEQKLIETANILNEAIENDTVQTAKSFTKLRESWDAKAGRDMGTVLNSSSKEEIGEESPAWQRKEGKSESGGLNRKGIESYRRENPGSKLSMAVTTKPSKLDPDSKAAKRRKSFCARMGGMKKRLTSAKTANDPDSRINKALRKWNCEE